MQVVAATAVVVATAVAAVAAATAVAVVALEVAVTAVRSPSPLGPLFHSSMFVLTRSVYSTVGQLGSGLRAQNWDVSSLIKFEKNFYE